MSRAYAMNFEIHGFNPEKRDAIMEAANDNWDCEEWYDPSEQNPELTPCLSPMVMAVCVVENQKKNLPNDSPERFGQQMTLSAMSLSGQPVWSIYQVSITNWTRTTITGLWQWTVAHKESNTA